MFLFHGFSFWEGGEDTSPLRVPGKRAVKNLFMKEKYAVSSVIDKNPSVLSPGQGSGAGRMCLTSGGQAELLLGVTLLEFMVA